LEVFLDDDNLVQGAFDQKLWSTMGRAKNVVLVWTKSCMVLMDRFLHGNDPTCGGSACLTLPLVWWLFWHNFPIRKDFVRKEYESALKLQTNIAPVRHEKFDWSDASRLPAEISSILRLNAVKYHGVFRDANIQKITTTLVRWHISYTESLPFLPTGALGTSGITFSQQNTVDANKYSVAVDHDGCPSGFIYEGEGVLPEVLTSLTVCFMRFALQPASIICCGRGWGFTGYCFSSIGKFNLTMLPSAWATFWDWSSNGGTICVQIPYSHNQTIITEMIMKATIAAVLQFEKMMA
jgi:hypothetical protein